MKVTNNKIQQNWIIILIIMIVGFSLVGLYILISGNRLTKTAIESFYNYNIEEKKEQSKLEVSNRLDEINFERSILIETEKIKLYNKIYHIKDHLGLLLNEIDPKPKDLRFWAINELEKDVSNDKDYLYFVIDTQGVMLRSGTDNNIVGQNLYNSIDNEGKYFIQEIISAKDKPDGIFVEYYWPKKKGGLPLKKISFCLYLPEFNLIIGTGVYHEDLQNELKTNIYNRLQGYYENKENYIFVSDYDSTIRVSGDPQNIGQKLDDLIAFDGKSIHKKLMDVIQDGVDGFTSYKYYKKNGTELIEKLAYVHKIDEWNAYIGTGFYIDDLLKEVDNYRDIFKRHYYNEALYIILGLFLLSLIVYAIFQRGALMQKVMLKQSDLIYEKLFELSNDAIVVISDENEILYENQIANNFFYNDTINQINLNLSSLIIVNENTYQYINKNSRKHYIKVRKEHVLYNSKESTIFFINDVTKEFVDSSTLEKMAYLDDLTGLKNRRALKDFYEDILNELGDKNNYIIGMLDIDKFKNVNDTYGHQVGDQVLKILSETFNTRIREKDAIFRYGGEEFIFLLNSISLTNAKKLIEMINLNFCNEVEEILNFKCTFSCGLININELNKNESLENIIKFTDILLYKAKENGRNRVEI